MGREIILASASPRRREILNQAGYTFDVRPTDVDEENVSGSPEEIVRELAKSKAIACAKELSTTDAKMFFDSIESFNAENKLIIGADTLVFLGDTQLGKPANKEVWRNTIKSLSGRTHKVLTGVSLIWDSKVYTFCATTEVSVCTMTDEEIEGFIERDEDMDKAGGYAIQGAFARYIPTICGEYNNVVGFPIAQFTQALKINKIDL